MSDLLDPATDRALLRIVAMRQTTGRVPSIAAALVREGSTVWSSAYGVGADVGAAYRIGSITKTFTAVLILQLMAEGEIAPSTPVGDVLGDIGGGSATIGELLSHTGGVAAEPDGQWWERAGRDGFTELAAANAAAAVFEPGYRWHYSNLGFAWLGEVVARLRRSTWWEATRERLLEPLGMSSTGLDPADEAVTGWSVDPYTGEVRAEPASDTGAMAPAGQIWSTVSDLARWATFLGHGNAEILPDVWLDRALTPRAGVESLGLGFGYGWGCQFFPGGSGTLVGHLGSMPGFQAALLLDRPRRSGVVCVGNATAGLDPLGLGRHLLEELERRDPAIPAPWVPLPTVPDAVRDVVGPWHWGSTPFRMTWDGNRLSMGGDRPMSQWELRDGPDGAEFVGVEGYHDGERLRVVRNADGSVNHLNASTFILTRTPYDPAAPIPGDRP